MEYNNIAIAVAKEPSLEPNALSLLNIALARLLR